MKRWMTINIAGKRWTVDLVSPKNRHLVAETDLLDGCALFDKRRILINEDLDEEGRSETLLHEFEHVLNQESGANAVLEGALPVEDADRFEEAIVRVGTPHRYQLLKALGFRFPAPHP